MIWTVLGLEEEEDSPAVLPAVLVAVPEGQKAVGHQGEISFPHEEKDTSGLACLTLLTFVHMTAFVVINAENPGLNVFTLQTRRERRLSVSQAGLEGR